MYVLEEIKRREEKKVRNGREFRFESKTVGIIKSSNH
jgi:hypothetical protein